MSRVLVLGAGVSGLAAARLATREGFVVTVFDENPDESAFGSGLGLAVGPWDHLLLTGVDLVIASPGFSERSRPIVDSLEAGLPIWSEIEFAARRIDAPLVAITGTNGKTTVTEATSRMLVEAGMVAPATGNIGHPLSDFVGHEADVLVVETSSFQLRFIEDFHPTAAAITNVAVDHLDWHGSTGAYRDAKRRIFENQTVDDFLVYDADDSGATELSLGSPSELFPVSGHDLPEGGGGIDGGRLVVGDVVVDLQDLVSSDPIHVVNLATSSALAARMGADPEAIVEVATRFHPGAHRRQVVRKSMGVAWVNDSKATNPHAALASIRAHDSVILIAGGLAKGMDVTPLGLEPNVKAVLGIGEAGEGIAKSAGAIGDYVETLERAVGAAAKLARPGDVVLLAPGCASFDQFKSYEERGAMFEKYVIEILEEADQQ